MLKTHIYECSACDEMFSVPDPLPKPARDFSPKCPKCGSMDTSLAYSMTEGAIRRRPSAAKGGCCGGGNCC